MNPLNLDNITISTNRNKLNLKFIHDFISNSYWGFGRTYEEMKICIKNSMNFGIYADGNQIGYARIVTDQIIFAYIFDVFIIETERKKGYSIRLLDEIFNHPKLNAVKNWKLTTANAHDLYRKYGFELLENPEKIMERK